MKIENILIKTIEYSEGETQKAYAKCRQLESTGWGWVCGGINEQGLWGDYDPNKKCFIVQLDRIA